MNKYTFVKPNRDVRKVFLHCSASSNPEHDDVSVIREWHLDRGWSDVGYHFFIKFDGTVQEGRSLEQIPAAQAGYNTGSIAICLHGLESSTFRVAQMAALQNLAQQINSAYKGEITFHGHCEVSDKRCPVFGYKEILSLDSLGYLTKKSLVGPNILQIFDRGMDVVSVQIALNRYYVDKRDEWNLIYDSEDPDNYHPIKGAHIFPLEVDGIFGASTQRAIMFFQTENDLEPDGIIGPLTRLKLPSRPGI